MSNKQGGLCRRNGLSKLERAAAGVRKKARYSLQLLERQKLPRWKAKTGRRYVNKRWRRVCDVSSQDFRHGLKLRVFRRPRQVGRLRKKAEVVDKVPGQEELGGEQQKQLPYRTVWTLEIRGTSAVGVGLPKVASAVGCHSLDD